MSDTFATTRNTQNIIQMLQKLYKNVLHNTAFWTHVNCMEGDVTIVFFTTITSTK